MTCLITFIHQDLWYGKLGPCSHQRGKPSHPIICDLSGRNNRIWKGILISGCLREEWALVNVSSCSGAWNVNEWWFLLRLIVGIMASVGMLAAPFRPLYKRISLLSLLLFLRDSRLSFFFFFFFSPPPPPAPPPPPRPVFQSYCKFQSSDC